ncbi:MAG: class I SAM-dependent methyltransferase [Anaerolineaceae bacterium]|nr:class I SAM-dependent methyltransferase [Anaerolineaceae bacterium]
MKDLGNSYTRGNGLLEKILAELRAQKANQLIPDYLRSGRILDIGCGANPYFLSHTYFSEKFAIDQQENSGCPIDINWHVLDLNNKYQLDFEDSYFSVVTMLAVVEHLDPMILSELVSEIFRILIPGGVFIMTTPAAWSDGILKTMAIMGLVSKEEIDEHQYTYTLPLLGWYMGKAGFDMDKLQFGLFEFGLNLWAKAEK